MFLTRIGYGIAYFLVLIYEIIKATLDVAFNGVMRRNIDPIVVDIETVLERPVSQTILVKVAAISPRKKEDIIPFEHYIKKMLE